MQSEWEEYEDGEQVIGKGGYGKVVRVGDDLARKQVNDELAFFKERAAQTLLTDCSNVIPLHDSDIPMFHLLFPLYDADLRKFIREMRSSIAQITYSSFSSRRRRFSAPSGSHRPTYSQHRRALEEPVRWERRLREAWVGVQLRIAADICVGLYEIHVRGCLHCDVSARNVLVKADPATFMTKAVLADLGLVSPVRYAPVTRTAAKYRDPDPYNDFSHDIWSVGIIFGELFAGVRWPVKPQPYPFATYHLEHASFPHPLLHDLVISMVDPDRYSRPSILEVLQTLYEVEGRLELKLPGAEEWRKSMSKLLTQAELRSESDSKHPWRFGFQGVESRVPRLLAENVLDDMVEALRRAGRRFDDIVWAGRVSYGKVLDSATLALTRFLHVNRIRPTLRPLYCCATLVLLSSIYYSSYYSVEDAIQDCKKVPETVFHTVIGQLIACRPFVEELFLLPSVR